VINVFNSRFCTDISLNQCMALTPPDLVRGHLGLDDTVMAALRQTRQPHRALMPRAGRTHALADCADIRTPARAHRP